ncbi:hypothetical protein DB41_IJ00150 [Neochlamydia sp. TUME1]|nr:hypothetical protein DB41_IJ00150 [Neochlamydia sp. TUME1]
MLGFLEKQMNARVNWLVKSKLQPSSSMQAIISFIRKLPLRANL